MGVMSWRDRVTDLLYDGETVHETVDVGANRVHVTSHRVLAFSDAAAGDDAANLRQIDLPNVEGVTAGSDSDRWSLAKAIAWGIAGAPFLVGGVRFEFSTLVSTPESLETGTGAVAGTGGALSLFRTLFAVLALLDEAVAAVGALCLIVAAAYAWRWRRSRERVVTVAVAGGDDVRLRVDGNEDAAAIELRRTIQSA
jgi:hypothetical protein